MRCMCAAARSVGVRPQVDRHAVLARRVRPAGPRASAFGVLVAPVTVPTTSRSRSAAAASASAAFSPSVITTGTGAGTDVLDAVQRQLGWLDAFRLPPDASCRDRVRQCVATSSPSWVADLDTGSSLAAWCRARVAVSPTEHGRCCRQRQRCPARTGGRRHRRARRRAVGRLERRAVSELSGQHCRQKAEPSASTRKRSVAAACTGRVRATRCRGGAGRGTAARHSSEVGRSRRRAGGGESRAPAMSPALTTRQSFGC